MPKMDAEQLYRKRKARHKRIMNNFLTYHATYALNYKKALKIASKAGLLYHETYEVLLYCYGLTCQLAYFKRLDLPSRPTGAHHLNYLIKHNYVEKVRGTKGLYRTTYFGSRIASYFSNILGRLIMGEDIK